MSRRILLHIAFWFCFMAIFVIRDMLFAGPSDLKYPVGIRVLRFFFSELSLLPWKATPFYALFYFLIPRYFSNGAYLKTAGYFLLILGICLIGYRSMVGPVSQILYGEPPEFNVFSFRRFIFTLTDLLPALGMASTIKLLKSSVLFRKKEAALQHEKRLSELNFLKARTNSHFLFNTLNNLYGLVRRSDPEAADSILKLSSIIRYILQECDSDAIPIQNEIKIINDYLALESLRYDERLQVQFDVAVEDNNIQIPPLILLPFVENAFKHGVSETRENPYVDINLDVRGGRLHFQVNNSWDHEEEPAEEGIGLNNVKRLLDLVYSNHYTLQIKPENSDFEIELTIDLNQKNGYEFA